MPTSTTANGRDSVDARRRARDDRGLAPASGATGDRLPRAPRERRPLLAALAVLLIVGGAALAGLFALRADERVPMLQLVHDVPAGVALTRADLQSTPVSSDSALLVPAGAVDEVVGQFARVGLTKGQLLDSSMLTPNSPLTEGSVAVGAQLATGRVPASGLQAGDVVDLVSVADGDGSVLVRGARVSSAHEAGSGAGSSGGLVATFYVDSADGAKVAGVAAAGDLAVVLVQRGTPIDEEG
jgi:hypothetical protein